MTDFATWLREWASGEPTLLEGEYSDLANLCAQQHEALEAVEDEEAGTMEWDEWLEDYHDPALRAAEAFKEKYSHDTD